MTKPDWYECRNCGAMEDEPHKNGCTNQRYTKKMYWKQDKLVERGFERRNSHFIWEGAD